MKGHNTPWRNAVGTLLLSMMAGTTVAQVSDYTFSRSIGPWEPIAGQGTPLGLAGVPPPFDLDDIAFVVDGQDFPIGSATTGNGWPIGFAFTFNGIEFDRLGFSSEGWLALGRSEFGSQAVFVSIGSTAYTPLSSGIPGNMDPSMRHRIVGFANDLMPGGGTSPWPIQIMRVGTAPNRTFVAEYNLTRSGGGGGSFSFQIRLAEGGGDPAQQIVQIVYGPMSSPTPFNGQVGLGGGDPSDFNNREVSVAPYDWQASQAGTNNSAACVIPTVADNLPVGLTFTWTPPACRVSGIDVRDFAFVGAGIDAVLSWAPVVGANGYEYVITTGGPSDPPVLSGTGITGTTVDLVGLPTDQDLFVYVRADCNDDWGIPYRFSTSDLVRVTCGEAPIQVTHCYENFENRTWTYFSSTGDPMRLIFNAGNISVGDVLTVYDGPDDDSPLLFSAGNATTVPGQTMNSTGDALTLKIVADQLSSCANTEWIDPLEWVVGCVDCEPVLASYNVINDCDQQEFSVRVDIITMGSATEVVIFNNADAPIVTAPQIGSYTVGPFPIGVPVLVEARNEVNEFCSSLSLPLVNGPCPVVSCGPDEYTHCYDNNEDQSWLYRSPSGERIGIRFLEGTLASGDVVQLFDGEDPFMSTPLFNGNNGGDLAGLVRLTTPASDMILLRSEANGSNSCATGQATEWRYVIACHDGCEAPVATFTVQDDCANGNFSVAVTVTGTGSNGTLSLHNNAGASEVPVAGTGTYTVGPFNVGTAVRVSLEGTNVLCGLTSQALSSGCGVGMNELRRASLGIAPNPGDGAVHVVLPEGFEGGGLEVFDITGRRAAANVLPATHGRELDLDLRHLPAGSYVLVFRNANGIAQGRYEKVR